MTKLDDRTTKRMCDGLKLGLTYVLAAKRARISISSHYGWMQKGRAEEEGPYRDYLLSVEEAEAHNAEQCINAVMEEIAGDVDRDGNRVRGDWRAAVAMLRYRHEFSEKKSVELTGKDGGPIQTESVVVFDFNSATDEQLAAAKAALTRKAKETP